MTRRAPFPALLALTVAIAAACGGGAPEAESPPAPSAEAAPTEAPAPEGEAPPAASAEPAPSASAAAPPAPPEWKDMNHDQRMAYMKDVVTPHMGKLFTEFDKEEFPEVTCGTCHGKGAKEGKYEMPNPGLTKLGDFAKLGKAHPKAMKFMGEVVKPEMAKLLGEKPMDESGQGFGCFRCHTKP